MTQTVDARGLSCPQPVLLTRKALLESNAQEILVLVDTPAQVQNCSRAAEKLGWKAACVEKEGTYELTFRKEG